MTFHSVGHTWLLLRGPFKSSLRLNNKNKILPEKEIIDLWVVNPLRLTQTQFSDFNYLGRPIKVRFSVLEANYFSFYKVKLTFQCQPDDSTKTFAIRLFVSFPISLRNVSFYFYS